MRISFSSRTAGILSILLVVALASACGGSRIAQPGESAPPSGKDTPVAVPNTIVATVNPAGPVKVQVGKSQSVSIVFTSSDGNPATDLSITTGMSPLPAGWTSSTSSLTCASVASGDGCKLNLNYAPSAAAPASTLSIGYRYIDRAGATQMASVSIAYGATQPSLKKVAYVTNFDRDSVTRCDVEADGVLSNCSGAGATGLSWPMSLATADGYAYIVNNGSHTVTRCAISADGAMSNCRDAGASMLNYPTAITIWGMTVYVANPGDDTITQCTLDTAKMLSDCKNSGAGGLSAPNSIAFKGAGAYIVNRVGNNVRYCLLAADNGLSDCVDSSASLLAAPRAIATHGSVAYIANDSTVGITQCAIAADGTLSACRDAGVSLLDLPNQIAIDDSIAYIVNWNGRSVIRCTIESDGALANCKGSGATGLNGPTGIFIHTIDPDLYGESVPKDELIVS